MSRPLRVLSWLAPLLIVTAGILWYTSQPQTDASGETLVPPAAPPEQVVEAPALEASVEQDPVQVEPELVEETREPIAETQVASELSGSVVDAQGEAIEGVHLSWTSWADSFTDYSVAKTLPTSEVIEVQTVHVQSDAKGRFSFEQAPPELGDAIKSVLWITHPEHIARSYLLSEDRESWPELDGLVLQPGTAMTVLVREAGQPVPKAVVTQRASVHRRPSRSTGGTLDVLSPLPDMPLVFLRTHESDANGQALLAPMDEPQHVQAQHEGLESVPWVGFGRSAIALDLSPTFFVEGLASMPTFTDGWGLPRVMIYCTRAGIAYELVVAPVEADGSFGPLRVPLLAAEEYIARLDGNVIVPEELPFAQPTAGEQVFLEFQAEAGSPVWFAGVELDGEIIKDTEVTVTWESSGRHVVQRMRADDNGYVLVPAIPPGLLMSSISAPGYQANTGTVFEVPEPQAGVHPMFMQRGAVIEGVCMQGGAPASDFEVRYWWSLNKAMCGSVVVRGSLDGEFVIDGAPFGPVGLEAFTTDYRRSQSLYVEVEPGAPTTRVEFELVAPRTARGKVVEAGSREPLPEARIQLYSSEGYLIVDPIGPPDHVAADGTFEITKLGPGIGVLLVEAPGRSSRLVHFRESKGEVEELGVIELDETQPLTVRILSDDPSLYAGYSVAILSGPRLPRLYFSAKGVAVLDEMSSGNYEIVVMSPQEGEVMASWVILKAGEEWNVDFNLVGQCDVTIHALPGEDGVIPAGSRAHCSLTSADGAVVTRYLDLDDQGRGQLNGVGLGTLDVWAGVMDTEGMASLTIGPDSHEVVIEIPLSSRSMRLRVVDTEGAPLSSVSLDVYNSISPKLSIRVRTNNDGECIVPLPEGANRVTMTDSSGGVQTGVPFAYSGSGDEVVELTLDTNSTLQLHLTGDEVPSSKLACRLFDPVRDMSLVAPQKPDADRLVLFKQIGPGDYRIQVSSGECWTVSQQVTVGKGQASASVELRRLGGLELKARRSDGSLAANMPVELIAEDLGESVAQWISEGKLASTSLATNAQGILKLSGLPRGRYQWSCGGNLGKVDVVADTTEKKTLLLP